MTLQELGGLGEFVAAVATVATLVYLAVQIRAGILPPEAMDFGGAGLFRLPYYHSSWPLYRGYLTGAFVEAFERQYDLDPSLEAAW